MRIALAAFGGALFISGAAAAEAGPDAHAVVLTLKDHRFTPESVTVPVGRRIRIDLINQDAAMEEFDSEDLGVEKDVTPNGKVSFFVGPLKAGAYSFMGELHSDTASGELKAVDGH